MDEKWEMNAIQVCSDLKPLKQLEAFSWEGRHDFSEILCSGRGNFLPLKDLMAESWPKQSADIQEDGNWQGVWRERAVAYLNCPTIVKLKPKS